MVGAGVLWGQESWWGPSLPGPEQSSVPTGTISFVTSLALGCHTLSLLSVSCLTLACGPRGL